MPSLATQSAWLFLMAIPISCIAWTVTHEELFNELRNFCRDRSEKCRLLIQRKFFYLFTCEYCFSHYITIFFLWMTRFKLLLPDWRGYVLAGFALVYLANFYMSMFARLRLDIRQERIEIDHEESSPPAAHQGGLQKK
jgi:hypothetical protein